MHPLYESLKRQRVFERKCNMYKYSKIRANKIDFKKVI